MFPLTNSSRIYRLARISLVAALYFVCTVALAPISFGAVQFRLSEILVLLCFYKKDYCYSLILGCALANLFSPLGIYDVIFGTLATALTVIAVSHCRHLLLATLFPTLGLSLIHILNNKCMFDGSSIEGFVRIEESDMELYPDLDTFMIYPWKPTPGKVARVICDVHRPDGTPFDGDPRYILRRVLKQASEDVYKRQGGEEVIWKWTYQRYFFDNF